MASSRGLHLPGHPGPKAREHRGTGHEQIPPQDSRGYFMLPQKPEGGGFYVYGELDDAPCEGRYQYAHPDMISAILRVEHAWQSIDKRQFGVGDISLAGGPKHRYHATHMSGLEVDVRPLRKDGRNDKVTYRSDGYDREGTSKLIALFRTLTPVVVIYFNDLKIPFVRAQENHHHHFHVQLRG